MAEESCVEAIIESINNILQSQNLSDVKKRIDQIFSEIKFLDENGRQGFLDPKVDECAIKLWNWGVTKKAEDAIMEEERAMVRHVSCSLVCWSEGSDPSEEILQRNIMMTMKTGKGWIDVGKPELATGFLEVAVNSLEKLYSTMSQRSAQEADVNLYKVCIEKELFKVLTYQAEAAVAQSDFESASARIQRCKEMLLRQPTETVYLSILCYNFGVETYGEKKYEQSSFWLSQSYEIGKSNVPYSNGHEMQAKVLRLLATVYLEWDCRLYQENALNTIRLANEEHPHPAGLFLKMKILLNCSLPDDVLSMAASEMLRHELSLDVYLNTVKLLMENARNRVGFDFLNTICKHFESSPEIEKALLLQTDLLLKQGKAMLAQQKIEDLITGHYTGKQLSTETLNDLHVLLWDYAAKCFENKGYAEALEWYNYSLSVYTSDYADPNFAKLQRNRASCFIGLNELSKAREAVTIADKCDPDNIFTHFILFKIALQENNVLEAMECVSTMAKMASYKDSRKLYLDPNCSATDLLSLAAKVALENNKQEVAVKALECVAEQSPDMEQVFISLRCLLRLMLSKYKDEDQDQRDSNTEIMMSYLNIAQTKLSEPQMWERYSEKRNTESQWFRKIAWNLAVNTHSPSLMRDCFLLSYKISLFCSSDKTILVAQKSCLIMAVAVNLDMARAAVEHKVQLELLIQSMESIQLCRDIWNKLKSEGDFSNDPTEILLLLYEFEIRAKLNDPGLNNVLECVWELPNLDAKTLESIGSLCMEAPAYYPSVCKKVLQAALSLHKKQDALDVSRLSKCLHSLVKLSLPERVGDLQNCDQEEAWKYYQEALTFISTIDNYPEVETLWLMTKAWNTGIFLYSLNKYTDAERWCALAMRLLSYLGSLRTSYESKMAGLYSDILDKMDKPKGAVCEE